MNQNNGEIILYQPDRSIRLEGRMQEETVWLTQQQMAILFSVDRTVIVKHIGNIYKSRDLEEFSTCAKIAQLSLIHDKDKAALPTTKNPSRGVFVQVPRPLLVGFLHQLWVLLCDVGAFQLQGLWEHTVVDSPGIINKLFAAYLLVGGKALIDLGYLFVQFWQNLGVGENLFAALAFGVRFPDNFLERIEIGDDYGRRIFVILAEYKAGALQVDWISQVQTVGKMVYYIVRSKGWKFACIGTCN